MQCSQCRNEVCLSSDVPCNKHNINVFNDLFAVPCNFLDEQTGNKTDFHNDLYHAKDSIEESKATYICISCQPFYLRSVKIQNEYEKAQAMFEETQKCSNTSSWSDPTIEATPQTGSFASTQMPDEPDKKFELPSISNLKVEIFTKGLQQLWEDQRPTKKDST